MVLWAFMHPEQEAPREKILWFQKVIFMADSKELLQKVFSRLPSLSHLDVTVETNTLRPAGFFAYYFPKTSFTVRNPQYRGLSTAHLDQDTNLSKGDLNRPGKHHILVAYVSHWLNLVVRIRRRQVEGESDDE